MSVTGLPYTFASLPEQKMTSSTLAWHLGQRQGPFKLSDFESFQSCRWWQRYREIIRKIYAGLQLTQTDTEDTAKDPCSPTQKLLEKLNPIYHTSNHSTISLICALKVGLSASASISWHGTSQDEDESACVYTYQALFRIQMRQPTRFTSIPTFSLDCKKHDG